MYAAASPTSIMVALVAVATRSAANPVGIAVRCSVMSLSRLESQADRFGHLLVPSRSFTVGPPVGRVAAPFDRKGNRLPGVFGHLWPRRRRRSLYVCPRDCDLEGEDTCARPFAPAALRPLNTPLTGCRSPAWLSGGGRWRRRCTAPGGEARSEPVHVDRPIDWDCRRLRAPVEGVRRPSRSAVWLDQAPGASGRPCARCCDGPAVRPNHGSEFAELTTGLVTGAESPRDGAAAAAEAYRRRRREWGPAFGDAGGLPAERSRRPRAAGAHVAPVSVGRLLDRPRPRWTSSRGRSAGTQRR